MPQQTERIYYHVTFQTRQRKPILYEEVESHLVALLPQLTRRGDFSILETGCALTHSHLLIERAPWADLLHIIHALQAETSDSILQRFPELELDLKQPNLWDTGFHYVRHDEQSVETVKQYIRRQKQHHRLAE